MDAAGDGSKQLAIYGAGKGIEAYQDYLDEKERKEKELRDQGMSPYQARTTIKAQTQQESRAKAQERNAKLKNAAKTAKNINAQAKKLQSVSRFAKLFK